MEKFRPKMKPSVAYNLNARILLHTFSESGFNMCPKRSQKGCPAATHSFCTKLWNPVIVRKYGSKSNCIKLEITQHMSLPAPSEK